MMFERCILIFFLFYFFGFTNGQQSCQPPLNEPSCVCSTPDGTIDLTSLSNTDGTPRFQNIPQSDGNTQFTYSYNPCTGYSEGDPSYSCGYMSVAACQSSDNGQYYNLGDPSTETMYIDSSTNPPTMFLQYDNGDDSRITQVYLTCDENADSPQLTADGDGVQPLTYVYHLTTKCACPNGCSDDPIPTTDNPGHGGDSSKKGGVAPGIIGIVLILVLIIGLVTYFVVGAIVLNKKYEKQGKEMIPQKDLWLALPFLVKDGFVFTFKPIINLIKNRKGGGGGDEYEPLK